MGASDCPKQSVLVFGAQLKFESGSYGWKRFIAALGSLNPSSMYSSANQTEKAAWEAFLPAFQNMCYRRVVFAAQGFSTKVHYAVCEYNKKYPTTCITLLTLADIKPCLGSLYNTWVPQSWKIETGAVPISIASTLHHSGWLEMTDSKRKSYTVQQLAELCKLRRIPLMVGNRKKKKGELIKDLNSFSLDQFLAHLKPTY